MNEAVRRLIEAARVAADTIKTADTSAGYCCCGDPIEGHGSDPSHGAVDLGDYYARRCLEEISDAIAAVEAELKQDIEGTR